MKLVAGMRTRCVNASPWRKLTTGAEYTVRESDGTFAKFHEVDGRYFHYRFKPIFRVKAPSIGMVNNG